MAGATSKALVGVLCTHAFFCAHAALPEYERPSGTEMRAHYIDVGQGSAVLLEFECGAALIDTGAEKNQGFDGVARLRGYLDAFFTRRQDLEDTLDLLILTHAHIDHTRGVPTILHNYTVKTLVDNGLERGSGGLQQANAHRKAASLTSGMKWIGIRESEITSPQGLTSNRIDPIACAGTDPKFRVLWGAISADGGYSADELKNGNNSSVVTRLDFGAASFLFPGDLEEDVHERFTDFYTDGCTANCMLDVDVYHVAHHGSHNGTSVPLVRSMTPKLAVISMGAFDRQASWTAHAYGHPRQVVIDRLLTGEGHIAEARPIARQVMLADRGASRKKNTRVAISPHFQPFRMQSAIYGTGWDGTVVVTANASGGLKVDVEQ